MAQVHMLLPISRQQALCEVQCTDLVVRCGYRSLVHSVHDEARRAKRERLRREHVHKQLMHIKA